MNLKAVLSLGALAATGFFVFGKDKFSEYTNVLENLEMDIKGIRNISFNREISFKVDVQISNPTNISINVPGNQLVIKNLHFYTLSGKKLGTAYPNIADINLPANNYRLITNIPVSLSMAEIGNNLAEILDIIGDQDKLKIAADIEAFGKSFTINA